MSGDRLGDLKGLPVVDSYDIGIGELADGTLGVVVWLHTSDGPHRFHINDPVSVGCDILAAGLATKDDPNLEATLLGSANAYLGAQYVERHGWPGEHPDEVG